tara:strand:+ start:13 stop:294 length:282 start_codon:yes stop_codon:yes gene_type:complete
MPRSQGATNSTNYHYLLKEYTDDGKTQLLEQRYYKTQGEIQTQYQMKRCSIYHLINFNPSIQKKKYMNIEIIKLSPPIPVYSKVETNPSGLIT